MSQQIAIIEANQRKLSYRSAYPVPADGAYNEHIVSCYEAASAVAQVCVNENQESSSTLRDGQRL